MLVSRLIKTLISNQNLITKLSLVYLSRLVSTSCAGQMTPQELLNDEQYNPSGIAPHPQEWERGIVVQQVRDDATISETHFALILLLR
jgi:hypothetical protein